jgi:hypothetical protein
MRWVPPSLPPKFLEESPIIGSGKRLVDQVVSANPRALEEQQRSASGSTTGTCLKVIPRAAAQLPSVCATDYAVACSAPSSCLCRACSIAAAAPLRHRRYSKTSPVSIATKGATPRRSSSTCALLSSAIKLPDLGTVALPPSSPTLPCLLWLSTTGRAPRSTGSAPRTSSSAAPRAASPGRKVGHRMGSRCEIAGTCLAPEGHADRARLGRQTFEKAQRAQASEAAGSLTQMAARPSSPRLKCRCASLTARAGRYPLCAIGSARTFELNTHPSRPS